MNPKIMTKNQTMIFLFVVVMLGFFVDKMSEKVPVCGCCCCLNLNIDQFRFSSNMSTF